MHRLCLFMIAMNGSISRVKRDLSYGLHLLEGKNLQSELSMIKQRIQGNSYGFDGIASLQNANEQSNVQRLINRSVDYARLTCSQASIFRSCEDGFSTKQTMRESQSQNLSVQLTPFDSKDLSCEGLKERVTEKIPKESNLKTKTPIIAKSLHIK